MSAHTYKALGWSRRLRIKGLRLRKWLMWNPLVRRAGQPQVLIIVGCQRSGTSLLSRILEQDLRTTVLSEDNRLTGTAESRLRLKPYDRVNRELASFRAPLVVIKPLVESQHTGEMLKRIPRSKAIWLFRDYADVVNSDLQRFSSQIKNLKAVAHAERDNWRAERVSDATRSIVLEHFADDMPRCDAAALMWYARNVLFFETALDSNRDVLPCRYENLVAEPRATLESIYDFLQLDYPDRNIGSEVHTNAFGRGRNVAIAPEIEGLCDRLQYRLQQACRAQSSPNRLASTA